MTRQGRPPPMVEPRCIECGGLGVLTPGDGARPTYVCACGAKVGCHPNTTIPLGLPCGPATALARDKAHRAFDRLWRAKMETGVRRGTARNAAYKWLAGELGIRRADCHISHFDEETCRRVIDICRPIAKRILDVKRAWASTPPDPV